MKKEVDFQLNLDENQDILLDNHSFFNLLNVLHLEIQQLIELSVCDRLKNYEYIMSEVISSLSSDGNRSKVLTFVDELQGLINLLYEIQENEPKLYTNIESILKILEVALTRVEELQHDRFEWTKIPLEVIEDKLKQFFDATEFVSRNRFHIKYPPEQAGSQDYLVVLSLLTFKNNMFAPPVLNDIIRDLSANARKYSKPGTSIEVTLEQLEDDGIKLLVSDEGIGIPREEFDLVVQFEQRGTNAQNIKTMGNGFGLTKAYRVTKMFNGNFYIDSNINHGTTIELTMYPN